MASITGTKIPAHMECPVDTVLYRAVSPLVDRAHAGGMTPNMVTALSFISCLVSLRAYWRREAYLAVSCWTLAYLFDIADGMMARRFDQETRFGDWFDHVTDLVGYTGFICLSAGFAARCNAWFPLTAVCILAGAAVLHMSCQERNSPFLQIEALRPFGLCPRRGDIRCTRFFGVGTLNVAIAACMVFYCRAAL